MCNESRKNIKRGTKLNRFNIKTKSFKPRMYRMKVRISKKNLNNIAKAKKNQNNNPTFNTIGSYVESRK